MTEEMLSSDHNPARATPLALEIDSASQEEIVSAYTAVQVSNIVAILGRLHCRSGEQYWGDIGALTLPFRLAILGRYWGADTAVQVSNIGAILGR